MNLIDAIKSGKPFRRPCHNVYMKGVESDELGADDDCEALFLRSIPDERISLMPHDLLAIDWEIQESTVTITRAQFWNAVNYSSSTPLGHEVALNWDGIEKLARQLGLEDK